MKYFGLAFAVLLCSFCQVQSVEEITVTIRNNQPLIFQCNVTGDGKIQWFKEGKDITAEADRIEITEKELKLLKPTLADVTNYTCKMERSDGSIEMRLFKVVADVQLKKLPQSVNVVEGDKFRVACEVAVGEPKPTLKWKKGDDIIQPGTNDSHIHLESSGDYTNNVLIISQVEMDDRAEYTCIGENMNSSDNSTVLLRVKDKYAALWPFLGIVAEVIVLCTIIFIYERRRSKAEFDESDNEQNETKNAADNSKGNELRHRK